MPTITITVPSLAPEPSWLTEQFVLTDAQRQREALLRAAIGMELRRLWSPAPREDLVARYSAQVSDNCRRTAKACGLDAAGFLGLLAAHLRHLRDRQVDHSQSPLPARSAVA